MNTVNAARSICGISPSMFGCPCHDGRAWLPYCESALPVSVHALQCMSITTRASRRQQVPSSSSSHFSLPVSRRANRRYHPLQCPRPNPIFFRRTRVTTAQCGPSRVKWGVVHCAGQAIIFTVPVAAPTQNLQLQPAGKASAGGSPSTFAADPEPGMVHVARVVQ